MKAYKRVLRFIVVGLFATGSFSFALESQQPPAAGGKTDPSPKTGSEAFHLTVKVPLMSPVFYQVPLAIVNDDPVTIGDLTNALATAHEERNEKKKQMGNMDYTKMLDRLINVKLVIQEAAHIGLDELPEFKTAVEDYSYQALAAILTKEISKDIKADPAAVEKRYKDMVVEWKIRSLFFEKEDDATSMAEALKAGQSFDELAEKALADKKATGDEKEGNYVKPNDLVPHVASAAAGLEIGAVSPILKVLSGKKEGFTIFKLEDKRYPENEELRKQAEKAELYQVKSDAGIEFKRDLHKKYVTIREKTLKKISYDSSSEKQLEQLLKDDRVVAEIKGEKPVTVAELTGALQKKHYHGLVQGAKSKKLDKDKRSLLFSLIDRRLIEKEISERGIAKTDDFLNGLKDYKDSRLFGLFIEKVVFPDVKVSEQDLQSYFAGHKEEFQYPEMVKMSSLAFSNKRDAEAAIKKLAKGSDMKWVTSTADGMVLDEKDDESLSLNGSILSTKTLPEDIRTAIAGARAGDFRLYQKREDRFYILSVQELIPVRQQPYEEVRDLITEKAFNEKFVKAIDEWFFKLRDGSTVKIYL